MNWSPLLRSVPATIIRLSAISFLIAPIAARADLAAREYWTSIPGTSIAALTGNARYLANQPDGFDVLPATQAVGWWNSDAPNQTSGYATDFGQRIRGHLAPVSSGSHTFFIRSSGSSELWLSSDKEPGNKVKVAWVTNGGEGQQNSDWFVQASQKSAPIVLTAGQSYYFEIIHKAGTGSGHLAVGWLLPGQSGNFPTSTIGGARITPFGYSAISGRRLAARFLSQATFGPTDSSIDGLVATGFNYSQWIENQSAMPVTSHLASLSGLRAYLDVHPSSHSCWERRKVWMQHAMTAPDELRQRLGFALSEIFVTSDTNTILMYSPLGMASYYDVLLRNAFGNYRDLLLEVSLHPAMGTYLSHIRNKKANPAANTFPDENYAREIMQLFSIGLWMLNSDGTEMVDTNGDRIPTYDNSDVTELARVFTGLSAANATSIGDNGAGATNHEALIDPMRMWENYHDTGSKTFLSYNGGKHTIPGGVGGIQDITNAVDVIFNHPNVGPFIARQLIQRLVHSSPSSAYVGRVAAKFNNNGSGVRGDMKAVVTAILLDREARFTNYSINPENGRMREPTIMMLNIARAFKAYPVTGAGYDNLAGSWPPLNPRNVSASLGMIPQNSPSVFNFFMPHDRPQGEIQDRNLYAPEFSIFTDNTANSIPNYLQQLLDWGISFTYTSSYAQSRGYNPANNTYRLNLSSELALASNATALVNRIDELLTSGMLSPETRAEVIAAVNSTPVSNPTRRVHDALYLIATSPDFMIQR